MNTLTFDNFSGSIPLNFEIFVNGVSAAPEQAAENNVGASTTFTNTTNLSAYADASSFIIQLRAKSPGTTSATNLVRIDNITVDGALVVPEPSSTALLGLGGLALILRRRK